MNTLLIAFQGILAFVFLMVGAMKLIQTRKKVIASGGKWAEDFSDGAVKIIGVGEVVCGLGIILPHLLGMDPYFTVGSAAGIGVFMLGAFVTHLRRKEIPFLPVTGLFLLMAATVIYLKLTSSV